MKKGILLFFTLSLIGNCFGKTIHVPDDEPYIQGAIYMALSGDTVLVEPGTYTGDGNRDLEFYGKNIVLKSEQGPNSTVIDCQGSLQSPHRGFYIHQGEGKTARIEGFTVKNGDVRKQNYDYGAGIYCLRSSPSIENCIISNCSAFDGGGIYFNQSNALVSNSSIIQNYSDYKGGGIFCDDSNPIFNFCSISNNFSDYDGGGFYCDHSAPELTACEIIENHASYKGGAFYLDSGNTHLQNCLVISNKANYEGGAIYSTDLFPTLINSALYGNIADYKGGGIYCDAGNFEARNIIMWHNAPGEIEGNIEATYSDIEGYWPGHGNFAKDPCFVSPGSRNFSLSVGSPCIDAGDPETMNNDYCFPPSMGTVRNDMGAYGGPDACDWIQLPVMLELEVLLFPDFVLRGKFTQWKIAVRNVGEVPATVDQLKLKIQGPASFIKLLWSGSFSLAPNQETEQWLKVFVPLSSPLGQYTCTTVVYNNGEELASDSFQTEVVQ